MTTTNVSKRFPVICMECGKRFLTARMLPTCPKCHGSDIEPAEV
jgi:Zn finger protein HypA/HybF involved in hydrogenase expression